MAIGKRPTTYRSDALSYSDGSKTGAFVEGTASNGGDYVGNGHLRNASSFEALVWNCCQLVIISEFSEVCTVLKTITAQTADIGSQGD